MGVFFIFIYFPKTLDVFLCKVYIKYKKKILLQKGNNEMTNLMYAEALEKDVEYSIKLTYNKRKVRADFLRIRLNEFDNTYAYEFKSKSSYILVNDSHIESIEISKPLKAKEKTGKVCPRCLGNKIYPKFAHINGGRCFKCEGTGTV